MKKTILITIICCAVPCFSFAQGPYINTTIEGTLWQAQVNMVIVSLNPFDVELAPHTIKYGFSDGMMYQCMITDGDTCTPEILPEEWQPIIIMPTLGLVVISAREASPAEANFIIRAVFILMPWGRGYVTAITCGWMGEESQKGIGFINGFLVREAEDWTP